MRLLRDLKKRAGVIPPGEVFSIASTLYTPPVPAEHAATFAVPRPFGKSTAKMVDVAGLIGSLVENVNPQELADLMFDPELAARAKGFPEETAAEVAKKWSEARDRFEAEAKQTELGHEPQAGALSSTFFAPIAEHLGRYLKWARAAVDRGFNLFEPIGRNLKSPREAYLDAVFADKYMPSGGPGYKGEIGQTQRVLSEILGETHHVAPSPYVRLADVVTDQGFKRVARAYEVVNGIGTEGQIKSRMELAVRLNSKKDSMREIEEIAAQRMGQAEAKRIVRAWETMDRSALTREGVDLTTVMRHQAVGEKAPGGSKPPEGMPEEWKLDPEAPDFQQRLAAVEGRVPQILGALEGYGTVPYERGQVGAQAVARMSDVVEVKEAAEDVRRLPVALLNAGELVGIARGEPSEGGNIAHDQALGDAALALASAMEQAIYDGKPAVSVLHDLISQDISTATKPLQSRASDLIRSFGKELLTAAHEHGWVEESGPTMRETAKMAELIRKVQAAKRGKLGETRFRRPDPIHGEGPNPLDWLCHSPCRETSDIVQRTGEDVARELEKEGKPTRGLMAYVRNLTKLWFSGRPTMYSATLSYGRQMANPAISKFRDSLPARLLAGDRNRLGDLLPTVLHKRERESTDLLVRFKAKRDLLLEKAGFTKLNPLLVERPSFEAMSQDEKAEVNELGNLLDVVEGRADESALSDRAKAALPGTQELFHEAKSFLAKHVFRDLFRAAEDAVKDGRPMPPGVLRPYRRMLGDVTDPKQVLDLVNAVTDLEAGETATIHGQVVRGWGLKNYYPHIWAPSESGGMGLAHIRDPGADSDAEVLDNAAWVDGEQSERWKKTFTEDHARQHGFLGRTKQMRNLWSRLKDKDGYIRDFHWATDQYFTRAVQKVSHERMTDELAPLIFGDWKPVNTSSAGALAQMLAKVPGEHTTGRHSAIGSIDHHFGVRLRGNANPEVYRQLKYGEWQAADRSVFGPEQMSAMAPSWKSDLWRVNGRPRLEGDPSTWRVELSNSRETLSFQGRDQIEAAGMHIREGGLTNYTEGRQYEAIKDLVRSATGYDADTGRAVQGEPEGKVARVLRRIGESAQEFFNQTMLGGVINPKAFGVQFFEGAIQNIAGVGMPGVHGAMEDMVDGFVPFQTHVLMAADPAKAYLEAKERFKKTKYVSKVLPRLEKGHFSASALLSAEAGQGMFKPGLERARRISYASFRLGDLLTKEMAYYGALKGLDDVKSYQDPQTGQTLEVTPDYIPLGDMFTRSQRKISAYDVALKVVQQLHFTQPKWSQPGLVRLPGWPLVGHLGTQAANISAEFWYSMGALAKYVKTGDNLYEWQARKGGQYLAALAGAMIVARLLGRDIGSYVGPHLSDVGFGDMTLGHYLPAMKALPSWAKLPGFQFPYEKSLPMKAFFSGKPEEGIPAAAGSAMTRWLSGEQTAMESIGSASKNWLNHNSRNMALGPFTRSGVPLLHALTAERSDLDPERPWQVRDPWYFGADQRTRYRDSFDLYFGDLFLPGYSYHDSAEQQRSKWASELASVHGQVGQDLRKQLRSYDPDMSRVAKRELLRRGFKIEDAQVRRAALMDKLPSYVRGAFKGGMDTSSKLRLFSDRAADWEPSFRQLALRWILPQKKEFDPSGLPAGLWSEVQQALHSPWKQ